MSVYNRTAGSMGQEMWKSKERVSRWDARRTEDSTSGAEKCLNGRLCTGTPFYFLSQFLPQDQSPGHDVWWMHRLDCFEHISEAIWINDVFNLQYHPHTPILAVCDTIVCFRQIQHIVKSCQWQKLDIVFWYMYYSWKKTYEAQTVLHCAMKPARSPA